MDVASISVIIAAIGVIVGVVFAILELRNINKTRQMELVMSIYSLFTTQQYTGAWERLRTSETSDYDMYVKKHGLTDFMQVVSLFEGLGFLLHKKFLNIDLIRELMNESTRMAWEKVKPMVEDARKRVSQRRSGEYIPILKWFEYLYKEMKKREQTLQAHQ